MLLQQGNVRSFGGSPWYAIELCGVANENHRTEEAILAIARAAAKKIYPFQLFVPVASRNSRGITLLGPYIWIRGDFKSVGKLATHWIPKEHYEEDYQRAVVNHHRTKAEFLTDGAGTVIPIEDSFVQEMIARCRRTAEAWSRGIRVGHYARILYGPYRMFVGKIAQLEGQTAHLEIQLRVRLLKVQAPMGALENLGPKPRPYFA
jgi:transcription antitermination factor NusG